MLLYRTVIDAEKQYDYPTLKELNVPVVSGLEPYVTHECPSCGHRYLVTCEEHLLPLQVGRDVFVHTECPHCGMPHIAVLVVNDYREISECIDHYMYVDINDILKYTGLRAEYDSKENVYYPVNLLTGEKLSSVINLGTYLPLNKRYIMREVVTSIAMRYMEYLENTDCREYANRWLRKMKNWLKNPLQNLDRIKEHLLCYFIGEITPTEETLLRMDTFNTVISLLATLDTLR